VSSAEKDLIGRLVEAYDDPTVHEELLQMVAISEARRLAVAQSPQKRQCTAPISSTDRTYQIYFNEVYSGGRLRRQRVQS